VCSREMLTKSTPKKPGDFLRRGAGKRAVHLAPEVKTEDKKAAAKATNATPPTTTRMYEGLIGEQAVKLVEKDKLLVEKDKLLAENAKLLAEMAQRIAKLQAEKEFEEKKNYDITSDVRVRMIATQRRELEEQCLENKALNARLRVLEGAVLVSPVKATKPAAVPLAEQTKPAAVPLAERTVEQKERKNLLADLPDIKEYLRLESEQGEEWKDLQLFLSSLRVESPFTYWTYRTSLYITGPPDASQLPHWDKAITELAQAWSRPTTLQEHRDQFDAYCDQRQEIKPFSKECLRKLGIAHLYDAPEGTA